MWNRPKGPRKFQFLVDATGLTRFGGLILFQEFCKSLRLRYLLQHDVRWPAYHHRSFHPADIFLAHVVAIVAGIGRSENTQSLLHHGVIPPLLGLRECPHRDTLRTFLWRSAPRHLARLEAAHDRFRTERFQRLGLRYDALVDAETTAWLVDGHQEGTALGSIPKRRHRHGSSAPILASEGRTGLSWGAELRAGDVHAVTGTWPWLAVQLDQLPQTIAASRTRVRLDGAFYDKTMTSALDVRRLGYCLVAKMPQPLKDRMVAAKSHECREGWEAAEVSYTPFHGKEEHRFAAVRRSVTDEPGEAQQPLFTFKRSTDHRALVTKLALTPAAVYRFSCARAAQELLLRELKSAYALAAIPTRRCWANATSLELVLWACDLVAAFQVLCLPPEVPHWNIATVRRELWWLPAEWVRRGHRNYLRLPAKYPHADLLLRIQQATATVRPLI